MNVKYDLKFEEMKKYIPFLENMITRLETTSSSSSNPRQAQLDKIRSLRDLLSNKKKRMKMENLLKCEQVLINLYAKVEQRDTFSGDQKASDFPIDVPTEKEKSDLAAVRNKLKTVTKHQISEQDTLPEILGRTEINDDRTSGTKEPALFQRRPNQVQHTVSDNKEEIQSPPGSATKRNYTRVLVSPETSSRRWSPSETTERPLFSRRSPRKSPRRFSPNYNKKERKKSKESSKQSRKQKGVNITLKVPQESLNSLNTKDILSRIINCSDGDVDIETLRELRKQIRNELKKTGAKDDISELILNSYNKKKKSEPKEVEEGELSDSESEAIESIYGNLVVKEPGQTEFLSDENSKSRHIQICFVINSDDKSKTIFKELSKTGDSSEHKKESEPHATNDTPEVEGNDDLNQSGSNCFEPHRNIKDNVITTTKENKTEDDTQHNTAFPGAEVVEVSKEFKANFYKPLIETNNLESIEIVNDNMTTNAMAISSHTVSSPHTDKNSTLKETDRSTELPCIHKYPTDDKLTENALSEIDILKALKNEILSEINMPGTETTTTPPLHIPKVNKVVNAQEILPKKRISIEKYKEKSITPRLDLNRLSLKDENIRKSSLKLTDKECERFFSVPKISFGEEAECLDEHDDYDIETSDIYADLAPKSPDHDDSITMDCAPPIIIPVDPVKTIPVINKTDVDMRTLPISSPDNSKSVNMTPVENNINQTNNLNRSALVDPRLRDLINNQSANSHAAVNPERTPRHNMYATTSSTSNPVVTPNARTYDMTPTHQPFEIDQSNRTHVYVPSLSYYDTREREKSVTKEVRRWENTDSSGERRSRIDDVADMPNWNPTRDSQPLQYKKNDRYGIDNRDELYKKSDYPSFGRTDGPATDNLSFVRKDASNVSFVSSDGPITSNYPYGRLEHPTTPSYGRMECPPTPTHIFGRLECPPTPSHPFGKTDSSHAPSHPFDRTDCPPTPIHSFGRIDCPPTPSHSFGRIECPPTPNHPFGRNEGPPPLMLNLIDPPNKSYTDCPPTPTPLFGRNECLSTSNTFSPSDNAEPNHSYGYIERPQTPNQHFGTRNSINNRYNRPDFKSQSHNKDPRLNRKPDSESNFMFDDRDSSFHRDRNRFYEKQSQNMYSNSETYRNYDRESSAGRSNKYKYYASEFRGNQYNKDMNRERSMGRSLSKDKEKRTHNSKDRYINSTSTYEESRPRREKSVVRTVSQEDTTHLASRTRNASKDLLKETNDNKLFVSNADSSFVIDTRTTATFQRIIDSAREIEGFVNNFNARRKRATSVGRSLASELNVGTTCLNSESNKQDNKRDFRRASSVGREVIHNTDIRSFQEIKADFKTYNNASKHSSTQETLECSNSFKTKELGYVGRSRKDIFENQKSENRIRESKNSYFPRNNYRDPRVRRQFNKRNDDSPDEYRRRSGIVYSNDKIITGTILTSGYGVKNYKIPKIKRVTEEKEVGGVKANMGYKFQKGKNNNADTLFESNQIKSKEGSEKVVDKHSSKKGDQVESVADMETNLAPVVALDELDTQSNRRITRSAKITKEKSEIGTQATVLKTKKCKKGVYNSDSENDTEKERIGNTEDSITGVEKDKYGKASAKNRNSTDINSSFGITELEVFNDNTVTDSVIENIDALIADLDSDINTSKPDHDSPQEINREHFVEKDDKTICDEKSAILLDDIDRSSGKQVEICNATKIIDDSNNHPVAEIVSHKIIRNPSFESKREENALSLSESSIEGGPSQSDTICSLDNSKIASLEKSSNNIDSTTETLKVVNKIEDKLINADICSTPDSTINTDDTLQKLCKEDDIGSTQEVTSTGTLEIKPTAFVKESNPALNSIGSLLTYLDKSKIKELLNMLDDNSNVNEKIKKKLEKLSEIVSDDEDTSNDQIISQENAQENKFKQFPLEKVNEGEINKEKKTDEVKEIGNLDYHQPSKSSTSATDNDSKVENVDCKVADAEEKMQEEVAEIIQTKNISKKMTTKKAKNIGRFKGKVQQASSDSKKRVTRANAPIVKQKTKKPPRELIMLQEDIKEMFIRDDVLSATGLRTCRLAKLFNANTPSISTAKDETSLLDTESASNPESSEKTKLDEKEKIKKKVLVSKIKIKTLNDNAYESVRNEKTQENIKYKAGPKSKTKSIIEIDPYAFESDSISESTNAEKDNDSKNSSDLESDSIASANTFENTEHSETKKKPKRKRRSWQVGVIKPKTKNKKKKNDHKQFVPNVTENLRAEKVSDPDSTCFIDKKYCFRKNQLNYSCRFCSYDGSDIVLHYRNQHPHFEIPLSRMAPEVAQEAIEQCEEVNFKAISKIPSDKYVCIFCFQEFTNSKTVLETFFWHVVSTHTGEFKHYCSQCVNVNDCPYKLHIPPPPENTKKQLIGYICKKCNFTQLSLENLKTHVIVRHDDKQTAVYTINLSVMTRRALQSLLRISDGEVLSQEDTGLTVSALPETSAIEPVNESLIGDAKGGENQTKSKKSSAPSIQSKITFEGDDNISESYDAMSDIDEINIKTERMDTEHLDETSLESNNQHYPTTDSDCQSKLNDELSSEQAQLTEPQRCNELPIQLAHSLSKQTCSDILDYPHFKIGRSQSGGKEYFCCINGNNHFKTTLLISIKKHVKSKHFEDWDGYCYVCKVIVTPQGVHKFGDCLQHYLDKHIDDFPVIEKSSFESLPLKTPEIDKELTNDASAAVSAPKISVRPLSELTLESRASPRQSSDLPIIHSVTSFGNSSLEQGLNPVYQEENEQIIQKTFKYEEHQAEVLSKKYYLVVQTMMCPENLVKIFKCSGRFCSYTTDSAQEALAHATTHQRCGGSEALNCSYCDFNTADNAVDLVTHVFKIHGCCRYCCQQCFYRATTSQTVGAHVLRVHGSSPQPVSVLRTATTSAIPPVTHTMLTRDQAVAYYICGYREKDVQCKFKTFLPDKYCEHLEQRHAESAHLCQVCSGTYTKASELVHHMKEHGMMLYQCTWCIHGAENETGLLDHVSRQHPDKTPQAYLRIITNKDGSSEQRVLPLAILNKFKVPTTDITPTASKENPEREAKRSIEMEALIGPLVANSNETIAAAVDEAPVENIDADAIQTAEMTEEDVNETSITDKKPLKIRTSESANSRSNTDPQTCPVTAAPEDTEMAAVIRLPTPIAIDTPEETPLQRTDIKVESTVPQERNLTDICVLDSEDEMSTSTVNQSVIEISDEEAVPNSTVEKPPSIIPSESLHTCPKCVQVYKSMNGLRRHAFHCVGAAANVKCPHCTHIADTLDDLLSHYVSAHTEHKTYECQLCAKTFVSEFNAKKHLKLVHKENKMVVTSEGKNGTLLFSGAKKAEPTKERVLPKRKLSGPKTDEIPVKRKFDPEEIDQVPRNAIVNHLLYCSLCEFSTKVRLNLVRHLQYHAEQQPVSQKAPVNPVPHLETNEKHFDKMVNLASSSAINRTPEKSRPDAAQSVTVLIPPEMASCYPKYVPDRQRYTCGAKGCSYISLDEAMLRRHWETLHAETSNFRCVHCPPHQHLDTSKPLTAQRVISHLKMHDAPLYGCSMCTYYHYRRDALDKHFKDIHKDGRLVVVREQGSPGDVPMSTTSNVSSAPTMDLKPWQCGMCSFKSMLQPQVVNHCFKIHQSKMQFKCGYCPFRTSAVENVNKHQTNAHAGKPADIFYYFYREGSIPNEPDGTPRWKRQREKIGQSAQPEIKVEVNRETSPAPAITPTPVVTPISIDLNLVKKEKVDSTITDIDNSLEKLCSMFGQFCDPNGIKYKCPLCTVVMDETRDGMQSHLYEELNYRKWSCGLCSYKAFHKVGLTEHMTSEHGRQYDHIQLPSDVNIEKWVKEVLDHQQTIIDKHKNNLVNQKIDNPTPSTMKTVVSSYPAITSLLASETTSTSRQPLATPMETTPRYSEEDLEKAFGLFGEPKELMYCCPKCGFLTTGVGIMRDHLETELNKIRWNCSNCPGTYHTYHEAQFHCKGHDGPSRPVESVRDPGMRAAWLNAVINKQKAAIQCSTPSSSEPVTPEKTNPYSDNENSLLVVRYEKDVPTPDQVNITRKRSAPDSDDEKLVIDEGNNKKKSPVHCPYCMYNCYRKKNLKAHVLQHFNMKQYRCAYCDFMGSTKNTVERHCRKSHSTRAVLVNWTILPPHVLKILNASTLVCLVCHTPVLQVELGVHLHNNVKPPYSTTAKVLKCDICSDLRADPESMKEHYTISHAYNEPRYSPFQLRLKDKRPYQCIYCSNCFTDFDEYESHHYAIHSHLKFQIEYESTRSCISLPVMSTDTSMRRCARKSTAKLPNTVAKKSTTKLPRSVPDTDEEYSYYGTKPPSHEELSNVTTMMTFCNKLVPFTMSQLREHLNVEPLVLLNDCKRASE